MIKYKLAKEKQLTPEMINKYIANNTAKMSRQQKMFNYYVGSHDILKRTMADGSKPNNKIVNPYGHYISDIMTGYFMGEPVKYTSEDDSLLSEVSAINNYNDEASENTQLATASSIYGVAYEILYLDDNGDIRYKQIETVGCIPIYENTIEEDLLYFIRYYDEEDILTGNKITHVEVYSRYSITYYEKSAGALTFIEEVPHQWGLVPVCIFYNNEEELGDFEPVVTIIDAMDKLESDNLNDIEYFNDAYLVLQGVEGTDAEDIAAMKQNRVLNLPNDASAQWLIKDINDGYIENQKTRLDADIHKFSYCPAMTDENFSANASGVAMKYKLMGLENATSKKEGQFKKGIQRRLELICNILSVMGSSYDYRAIDIHFNRNIPANIVELADVVNKLGSLVSDKTKLSMLPIDTDFEVEYAQKQAEMENSYEYAIFAPSQEVVEQ